MDKLKYIRELLLRSKLMNSWVVFASDLVLLTLTTLFSLHIVNIYFPVKNIENLDCKILLYSITASAIAIIVCNTYKGAIRHSAITESARLSLAVLFKVLIIFLLGLLYLAQLEFRHLVFGVIFDFFVSFFVLIGYRMLMIVSYRFLWDTVTTNTDQMLVYWNLDNSLFFSSNILKKMSGYTMAGYIGYNHTRNVRVKGNALYSFTSQEDLCHLVNKKNIKAILFISRKDLETESERLVRYCERMHIRMFLLPALDEVEGGRIPLNHLHDVRIEDLLGRSEIQINMEQIATSLRDKVVLVTGAAGSIGSELCRQLAQFHIKQLVLFDVGETPLHNIRLELEERFPNMSIVPLIGDVRNSKRLHYLFENYCPDLIFHAAAYKHVPLMEENPCEAVHTNVQGTRVLADMAVAYGVERFIMISTDKAVNPTNVMGASKRLAEIYVQSLGNAIQNGEVEGRTQFITTRFGNVLGSNGSVIPRFRSQLAKGGPLTVTHPDIIRYFMTIPEACRLVLEASCMGHSNEIFVFDMGTPVKIADMARRMIELSGLIPDVDIKIVYTGLRPGEKLYEEVLAAKENTLPTVHDKIFRASVRIYDYKIVVNQLKPLIQQAMNVNRMETVRLMKEIVPEFKSNNSIYEVLDKENE